MCWNHYAENWKPGFLAILSNNSLCPSRWPQASERVSEYLEEICPNPTRPPGKAKVLGMFGAWRVSHRKGARGRQIARIAQKAHKSLVHQNSYECELGLSLLLVQPQSARMQLVQ